MSERMIYQVSKWRSRIDDKTMKNEEVEKVISPEGGERERKRERKGGGRERKERWRINKLGRGRENGR